MGQFLIDFQPKKNDQTGKKTNFKLSHGNIINNIDHHENETFSATATTRTEIGALS